MKKNIRVMLALVLSVVMLFGAVGCAQGDRQQAEAAVKNAFSAIKNADLAKVSEYVLDGEELADELPDEDEVAELKAWFEKMSVKVVSSTQVDEETVDVKIEVTMPDLTTVMGEYLSKAMAYSFSIMTADPQPSQEEIAAEMQKILKEVMEGKDVKTVSNTSTVRVVKKDGRWVISSTEVFAEALFDQLENIAESFENMDFT